jgi:hypothetical protein
VIDELGESLLHTVGSVRPDRLFIDGIEGLLERKIFQSDYRMSTAPSRKNWNGCG